MLRRAERVYRNAGIVHWSTGDFPGAKKAYGKAIDVMEMVRGLPSADDRPQDRVALGATYRVMAAFLFASGHDDEAAPYFAKARGHVERLVADLDNMAPIPQREAREAIGWFDVNAGDTAFANGDLVAARRSYERAIDMLTPVANVPKQWHWYRMYIGEAHRGLARVRAAGDAGTWKREIHESLKIMRDISKEIGDSDVRQDLGVTLVEYGNGLDGRARARARRRRRLRRVGCDLERDRRRFPRDHVVSRQPRDRIARTGQPARRHGPRRPCPCRSRSCPPALGGEHRQRAAKLDLSGPPRPGRGRDRPAPAAPGTRGRGRKFLEEGIAHLEQACRARPQNVQDHKSLAEAREARRQAAGPPPSTKP